MATIRFRSNVQAVFLELREASQEPLNKSIIVLGGNLVVHMIVVATWIIAVRESYADGSFNEHHVRNCVPGIGV